jgi:hypothetical protein
LTEYCTADLIVLSKDTSSHSYYVIVVTLG